MWSKISLRLGDEWFSPVFGCFLAPILVEIFSQDGHGVVSKFDDGFALLVVFECSMVCV